MSWRLTMAMPHSSTVSTGMVFTVILSTVMLQLSTVMLGSPRWCWQRPGDAALGHYVDGDGVHGDGVHGDAAAFGLDFAAKYHPFCARGKINFQLINQHWKSLGDKNESGQLTQLTKNLIFNSPHSSGSRNQKQKKAQVNLHASFFKLDPKSKNVFCCFVPSFVLILEIVDQIVREIQTCPRWPRL
jgi:hypothetical protein